MGGELNGLNLLEAALDYARHGWRVVPLHNSTDETDQRQCSCQSWRNEQSRGPCPTPGKHPRSKKFFESATKDEKQIRSLWKAWPRANVGIIGGKLSGIWALDKDPRNNGEASYDALIFKYGRLPYTMTCRTGGGGTHEYFRWPADFDLPAWLQIGEGLEVVAEGHVIVAPPSYHHVSGRRYEWEPELGPAEMEPQIAPAWLLDLLRAKVQQREPAAGAVKGGRDGMDFPPADFSKIVKGCGWMRHCLDDAAVLGEPEWYAQLSIVGRCEGSDELAQEVSRAHPEYNAAATAAKLRHAMLDAGPVTCAKVRHSLGGSRYCDVCLDVGKLSSPVVLGMRADRQPEPPLPDGPPADMMRPRRHRERRQAAVTNGADSGDATTMEIPQSDWRKRLLRTTRGEIRPVLANAITAFRFAPQWEGVLAWNEFSSRVVMRRAPDFGGESGANWTDHEDRLVTDWLHHQGIYVSLETAGQAVLAVARDTPFHPVREYLVRPKWDGVPRIESLCSLYFGTAAADYTAAVGSRFMRSAVARIFEPGCKVDCCLILEGAQGIKKSTALRALAQPWFSDELADLGSKDASLQTMGIWLVEIAELDSMTRAEVSKVKGFMSRGTDRFRPPYGRNLVESPRQCVFAGSVNHSTYLRDETGGRRFWPVACTRILIDDLARDRDQLWAEAVATYRDGQTWWLDTPGLIRDAEDEQAQRFEESAWDGLILNWLAERVDAGFTSCSIGEVLDLCIKKRVGEWTRSDEMRVGSALTRAGWKRFRKRTAAGLQWRYTLDVPT